jgi:hypothetical protein
MQAFSRWTRPLLLMALTLIALASTMTPAPTAQATQALDPTPTPQPREQHWPGWGLRVTFPQDPKTGQRTHQVIYTAYTYAVTPTIQVTAAITENISANCTSYGMWQYDGEYAIFDGTTNYIACNVPAWRDKLALLGQNVPCSSTTKTVCACAAGSAASGAAQVRLVAGTRPNPLIDASELGLSLSLPLNGGQARTRLFVNPQTYASPQWNIDPSGNRVVMGMDGPTMVVLDDYFKWMPYLNPAWRPWFRANIVGPTIGHIDYPTDTKWQAPAGGYELRTIAATVYIGRSATGGNFFRGRLADGIIDPPCKGG